MATAKELPDVLYRCELQVKNDSLQVIFTEFKVLRATPSGLWIKKYGLDGKNERWVPTGWVHNQFAFISKADALTSYYHRKKRHIRILKSNLSTANKTLAKVQGMIESKSYENTVVEELILW